MITQQQLFLSPKSEQFMDRYVSVIVYMTDTCYCLMCMIFAVKFWHRESVLPSFGPACFWGMDHTNHSTGAD